MAQQRKLLHIEMIVDASSGWDVMNLVDGKAQMLNVRTVKHGGVDEGTGRLQARPKAKDVVLNFARTRQEFAVRELNAEAGPLGISPGAIYQAIKTLCEEKVMTRTGKATYALVTMQTLPKVSGQKKANGEKERRTPPLRPDSISSRIVAFLKEHQGGGAVKLSDIKAGLKMNGSKNISPMMFDLMQSKRIERTGKSLYRATEG